MKMTISFGSNFKKSIKIKIKTAPERMALSGAVTHQNAKNALRLSSIQTLTLRLGSAFGVAFSLSALQSISTRERFPCFAATAPITVRMARALLPFWPMTRPLSSSATTR
jgi:hypothetical protein